MNEFSRIELAGQYGEPTAGGGLLEMKRLLQRCFDRHCVHEYCNTVKQFSVILRVSGELVDYGSDGVDRMRRNRQKSYITADFCVPETRWKGKSAHELQELLLSGVRHTLELEVARLKKDKERVNESELWADLDRAFQCFREEAE